MSKSDKTLLSVIIPAFNAQQYVCQAIESALGQTITDLEIILIDDGSQDATVERAESYGSRVRVLCQENSGAAVARNHGVSVARGKWIAFLDADDIWEPRKIEVQLNNCDKYAWSHTDSVFIGERYDGSLRSSDLTPKHGGQVYPRLVVNNFVGTSTVMVLRDVYLQVGGFDRALRALQDWDLWIRLAECYELGYISEVLTQYRVHPESTSRKARKTLPFHLEVIERSFATKAGLSFLHLRPKALAESFGICSIIAEDANDPLFSLSCALRALWYEPKSVWRWKSVARMMLKTTLSLFSRKVK